MLFKKTFLNKKVLGSLGFCLRLRLVILLLYAPSPKPFNA